MAPKQSSRRGEYSRMANIFSNPGIMLGTSVSHPALHSGAMSGRDILVRHSTPPPALSSGAYFHGNPSAIAAPHPAGLGRVLEMQSGDGADDGAYDAYPGSGDTWPASAGGEGLNGAVSAVDALRIGSGVPVVRRHSYTVDGKPRCVRVHSFCFCFCFCVLALRFLFLISSSLRCRFSTHDHTHTLAFLRHIGVVFSSLLVRISLSLFTRYWTLFHSEVNTYM